MSFLERIGELTKAVLTADVELKQQRKDSQRAVQDTHNEVQEVRERLARLETAREADLAGLRAEAARFMAEAEREALRRERRQLLPPTQGDE